MKRLLLSLATGVALAATSVVANAQNQFAFAYQLNNRQLCLVPEAFSTARVYWSAIKPNGTCEGTSFLPVGGTMNIRFHRDLGGNYWARLQQAAIANGVDPNFSYVYCRGYQGNGSKVRWNFVVRDSTGKDVSSGWWPDAAPKCPYDVPMNH